MKKIKLLLIGFVGLCSLTVNAQDLSGKWVGFLDQTVAAKNMEGYQSYWENGFWKDGIPTCYMELELEQEGDSLKGTYHCALYLRHDVNGTFRLVGQLKDKKLTYKTTGRIEEKSSIGIGFCHNSAVLRYYEKDSIAYLEGKWEGTGDTGKPCADAIVKLQKRLSPKTNDAKTKEEEYTERAVVVRDQIVLTDRTIQIEIWDDNREDGDSISLKLNNEWLVQKEPLKNEKKILKAKLKKGVNMLVIYAESLGEIPPNTAAVNIKYGDGRHRKIILQSTFWTSEAIRIKLED